MTIPVLVGILSNQNSHPLPVNIQQDSQFRQNTLAILYRVKHTFNIKYNNFTLDSQQREIKLMSSKDLYVNVYCKLIPNRQKLGEKTHMAFNL